MDSALFWLGLNFLTIIVLAFYSMEEMAFVSFNKVRLQFYMAQGSKRASWLNTLLQNPSQLFTTTLIGVNVATFVGSECARRFHEAVGLSPDIAPLSQIILVIIFGELAPMFAARRYAEHVALLGVPLVYLSSKMLTPFIWVLGLISKFVNKLLGGQETDSHIYLTYDELQKILEEQGDDRHYLQTNEEFNAITSNIFRLKEKKALDVMTPLTSRSIFSSQLTIGQLRELNNLEQNYMIVYHKNLDHIIGIAFIKDLLRAPDNKNLHDYCNSPWFISQSTPLLQILKQFRRSSEYVAIVLNQQGKAIGSLTFEDILDEIFAKLAKAQPLEAFTLIDRTLDGDSTLADFNQEFGFELPGDQEDTLSDWLIQEFEHHPEPDETLTVKPYLFTVKETSLLGVTKIQLTNLLE